MSLIPCTNRSEAMNYCITLIHNDKKFCIYGRQIKSNQILRKESWDRTDGLTMLNSSTRSDLKSQLKLNLKLKVCLIPKPQSFFIQ